MRLIRVRTGEAQECNTRADAGFSLVEMVVTVTLMGLAMIPILVAALSLVKTSSYNRNATKVETVLANAADRLNRTPESCTAGNYRGVAVAAARMQWNGLEDPESLVTTQFSYFVPGPSVSDAGAWTEGLCPPNVLAKDVVQMVTIGVTSPDGQVHRSMQVVKSKI